MRTILLLLLGAWLNVSAEEAKLSVGAYYYPWYDVDGRHWDQGYEGKLQGLKPAAGEYSSRSKEVIQKQLKWSEELGIDHWICSWWGPRSWEDETIRDVVLPELGESGSGFKICLLYESGGLLGLNAEEGIDFDSRSTQNRLGEHFAYLARNYFGEEHYLKVDGKPVVYFYLSRCFSGDVTGAMKLARSVAARYDFELYLVGDEVYWGEPDKDRIESLDAITSYNMHGPMEFADLEDWGPFLARVDEVYSQYREVAAALGVAFIPGVMPGFDSRESGGGHYPIPRSIFPEFKRIALRHLDPGLKTVAVTSFNEWHEGTQLEPREGEAVERVFRDSD